MIYEYDEIITAKDVLAGNVKEEEIIGKKGWFADSLANLYGIPRGVYGALTGIGDDPEFIFLDKDDVGWAYFLPNRKESYIELQARWVKANNLKPGDKVRILRRFEPCEDGFCASMNPSMEDLVGEVLTVMETDITAIRVWNKDLSDLWCWPYFVLEKVKDEPETEKPASKRRTWLEDIAYRLSECLHSRYVAFFEEDGYLMVSGFTCKPCFSEEDGIWHPGRSEKWSMYALSIPDAAYSDCPEEWKVNGKVDFSKAIIDMEADDRPFSIKRAEDAPEYVPFDLSDPKDRDFLRGKWIKRKDNSLEIQIDFFEKVSMAGTWNANNRTSEYLFGEYVFLDGSPVGRRKEEA